MYIDGDAPELLRHLGQQRRGLGGGDRRAVRCQRNIAEDPQLCDPENGDFTLSESSPCAPFSPQNPSAI